MIYDVNSIYNSKVSEIKSRINSRIETINATVNGNFKMYLDNAVSTNLQNKTSNVATSGNLLNKTDSVNSYGNTTTSNAGSPPKTNFDDIIKEKAAKYSVNENLIKAVIKAESGFNPNAVSSCGAQGLMQLMPATAAGLNVTNSFDPEQNIDAGVRLLKGQINQFGGNVKMALASYNCGPNRVKSLNITNLDDPAQLAKLPKETQNYIKKIYQYMNA